MAVIEGLKTNQDYKLKLSWMSRKVTKHFVKYSIIGEDNERVMEFNGKGGVIFVSTDHIESIEEVDATKLKPKKKRVCDRCNGAKYMEHLKHVEGGRCFKCGGTGEI